MILHAASLPAFYCRRRDFHAVPFPKFGERKIPLSENFFHSRYIAYTILTFPFVSLNTTTSEMIVVTVRIVASAAAVPSLIRTTS